MFDEMQRIIALLEGEGADFVEARYDQMLVRTIGKENGRISGIKAVNGAGVGFNVYAKGATAYAYSAELSAHSLEKAGRNALKLANASAPEAIIKLGVDAREPIKNVKLTPSLKKPSWKADELSLIDLINRIESSGKEKAKELKSIGINYGEISGTKQFTNSEGTEIEWFPYLVDLGGMIASQAEGGDLVSGAVKRAGSFGLKYFDDEINLPEKIGEEIAHMANEKRYAKLPSAGQHRTICDNFLVGVLAHESFGHLTEGDGIVTQAGPLFDKIGTQLGSDIVTIYDEGTPTPSQNVSPMYLPYDDEGIPTNKTVLMENGVLKGFLLTRATAKLLGTQNLTGNARAIHFGFPPIPRMKNTYVKPGELSEEELFEQLGTGIYAISTSGGQVGFTGDFVFGALMGYWYENGERKYPLRDIMLRGNILDLLKNVEGASNDFMIQSSFFGGCGKGGQAPLAVGMGGPKLLFKSVDIGGKS